MENTKTLNIIFFTGIIIVFLLSWLLPILQQRGIDFSLFECRFKKIFEIPCATCGITTAFASMIRGNIKGAFSASPLGVFLFSSLACCFVLSSVFFISGSARAWRIIPWKWLFVITLAVAVLSWIYKIVQYYKGGVYGG